MSPPPARSLLAHDVLIDAAPPPCPQMNAPVTQRELWPAHPGNCAGALALHTPSFRDYVARTPTLDTRGVGIVISDTIRGINALDVVTERGASTMRAHAQGPPVAQQVRQDARACGEPRGGSTYEGHVVTKATVHRTAGTYLEQIARLAQQMPAPGRQPAHRHADGRSGTRQLDFAAVAAATFGRTGLVDQAAAARIVLPTDTYQTDGQWRYRPRSGTRSVADSERKPAGLLGLV